MRHLFSIVCIVCTMISCVSKEKQTVSTETNLTQFVDPFIGTAFHGHTYPGATVPFGMIQLSPDNGTSGWDWCSGYHYSDTIIAGFSHLHLSGTGIGDLADISVMPTNKEIAAKHFEAGKSYQDFYRSGFSHDNEKAKPGYYQVLLNDDQINVELSTTKRVGFHRYTYSNAKNKSLILDLGFQINWDKPDDTYIKVVSNDMIIGHRYSKGWANYQKVHFAIKFSQPFTKMETFLAEGNDKEARGKEVKGVFKFDDKASNELLVKVAVSSASTDGAIKNLESDKNDWNFDQVVAKADEIWNNELKKIEIKGNNKDNKVVFYTALYHSFLAPYIFSDVDGGYKGYENTTKYTNGYTKYTVLSLWDTFRALKPLFTITQPDLTNDIIKSMLDQYQETGLLPVWELQGNETNCMIGYNAIPVIADAMLKGIGDFDKELAFEAMKASSMSNLAGLDHYRKFGYIPSDLENESTSKTLEYAYDDWCIAQIAKHLGKDDDYKTYLKRSKSYAQLFDKNIRFMRGKLSNGKWAEPFDPSFSQHRKDYFTEGNSWQWTWFVPHDVDGLKELMGGKEHFISKLDSLFKVSSELKGENVSADITGLIGQYAHGNEPSHHTVYLYNQVGQPWKTQEKVHEILTTLYTKEKDGLCGNEDCGQMSAWYVFSSMGIYPANPANGEYQFGSPLFEEAKLNLPSGKVFTIKATNLTDGNIYIQSATLNGKKLNRTYITHKELTSGGELIFEMGNSPKK
ncbi:glycoside hydrolase family 92 protein [Puteibacter caeruleilacunae]|nr:glycoside hydrolase family 92 protein [Puteibacter caeruleilacunae]